MQIQYIKKIDMNGDLMTVDEFRESVKEGLYMDDDGFGHPCRDGLMDDYFIVIPSQVNHIPSDATHVIWYNK